MGLDKLVQKASAMNSVSNYDGVCFHFPEDEDQRINNRLGYLLACASSKEQSQLLFPIADPKDNPWTEETYALDRLDNLAFIIRQIYNTGGNIDSLIRLRGNCVAKNLKHVSLTNQDLDIMLPLFDLLGHSEDRELFYEGMKRMESEIQRPEMLFDASSELLKKSRERHSGEVDFGRYFDSSVYVSVVGCVLNMLKTSSLKRNIIRPIGEGLELLKKQLDYERDRFERLRITNDPNIYSSLHTLRACLNHPKISLDEGVNCCITQPHGKSKEAAVLYALDKTTNVWSFSFKDDNFNYEHSVALALFIKAKGRHFLDKGEPKKYLILEGFPANEVYYTSVGKIGSNYWSVDEQSHADLINQPDLDFSKLVYTLGLKIALHSGIPRMFVNTDHSHRQKSVDKTVRIAAEECRLPKGEVWDRDSHGYFKLLKDQSSESLAEVNCGGSIFQYTHFLEKRPLPSALVRMLRKDPLWNGENVFDTWYKWNEFIMNTLGNLPDEFKKRYPYAEAVKSRGKDPQWNLGTGYCRGFEVDVQKECDKLGIK